MMTSDAPGSVTAASPDLIDCFHHSLTVSAGIENDTARQHPKFYDKTAADGVQNQRRTDTLSKLKRQLDEFRSQVHEFSRKRMRYALPNEGSIVSSMDSSESSSTSVLEEISLESLDELPLAKVNDFSLTPLIDETSPPLEDKNSKENQKNQTNSKETRKELRKRISEKFMLSEWLVDIPEDLEKNWLMLCCPKGRRTMVVAVNGRTKVYTRSGYFLFEFKSALPGGSRPKAKAGGDTTRIKSSSILDCIYVESEQRFYLLDVISWNGCSFLDCDTEFRFYWMKRIFDEEQLKQNDQLVDVEMKEEDVTNNNNNEKPKKSEGLNRMYDFKPLEFWPCTREIILQKSQGPYLFEADIDGILFYHKQAPYTAGTTPLVCWLKLSMIPKMFS